MPDSRQSVQSAVWTVPAALETIPVALQDAALCRKSVRLSGIVSECRQYEDQTVLKLKHIAISGMETGAVLPGNLSEESCICYLEKTTVPQIGSFVIVEGVPDAFSGARNPGEFDYARYYLGQGISFRLKDAVLISSSKSRMPYREALSRVRRYACGIFERYLDAQDAGVLSAMLLGEKTGLAKELRSLYAQSGIAHILAISGLHISLIGAMTVRLLRRIGAARTISMLVCFIFLGSYCVMTGMSASTIRAVVMFMIGLNAGRVRRTYDMKTAVGVSMALQLMEDPRLIGTAAFQLSFGAVCGIAWLAPALLTLCMELLPLKSRGLPKTVKAFSACIAVSLATLPILLVHQYEYALYGIFFNPLVLPGVSVLLPAGFLLILSGGVSDGCAACVCFLDEVWKLLHSAQAADRWIFRMACGVLEGLYCMAGGVARVLIRAAGMFAEAAAHAAAFVCRMILFLYESGSRWISALPGSLLRGRPQTARVILYALMLGGLIVWTEKYGNKRAACIKHGKQPEVRIQSKNKRESDTQGGKLRSACRAERGGRRRAGFCRGIFGIGWLAAALLILLVPVRTGLTVTMLDVGQGDGICIEQTPGHAVLIDCGSSDKRDLFENRLMPFLKYRGIYELDAVFLTHLDTDHVSAVYDLLTEMRHEKIKVGQIVIGKEIPHDEAYERLLAAAKEAGVPVHAMRAGDGYSQGACRLTCLEPSEESGGKDDRNARSLILRLDYGEFQALFMGDADAHAELAAVSVMNVCLPQEDIELLKAAHHGSKSSTSEEFLALVRPRVAVISAGIGNSYGHPHEETLARLAGQGCDIYQTPESGAVMIHVDKDGMRVETFLDGAAAAQQRNKSID